MGKKGKRGGGGRRVDGEGEGVGEKQWVLRG